ncbi:MAG: hypothetical protein E6H49_03290 [Betaproteobacteria bacterium]|nr:MAG: hypothetical protein E6H49_03290 [Betaproteobacteria bacterium]
MEILLASAVLAALITSLVNLRLASISIRSQRELEKFKQQLGLEIAKQLEAAKATMRADELAFSKIWDLRSYLKTNNIATLARTMGKVDDASFTKLCLEDVPALFVEYRRRLDECSVYLKDDRIARIGASAEVLRDRMKALAGAQKPDLKQRANEMLTAFAAYNTLVEGQIDEALGQGLENIKR